MTASSSPADVHADISRTVKVAACPVAEADAPVLTPTEALWVMAGMASLTLVVWAA